jgi:hypothetical protein
MSEIVKFCTVGGRSRRLAPADKMHLLFGPRIRADIHERHPVELHFMLPEVGVVLRQARKNTFMTRTIREI